MTRQQFLAAYRHRLATEFHWAHIPERLDHFMLSVEKTLAGEADTWQHNGPAAVNAWRDIGGKGKPTMKMLRGLP